MKVLIADDADDIRMMLRTYVEIRGCKALEAQNGFLAIEIAKRERPDLIFMDIHMPIMDGITAACYIHETEDTSMIPIVILSAYLDTEHKDKALKAGCRELLSKPVDLKAFEDILNQYWDTTTAE
jgi:CheY-like chemotaxis protein